MDRIFKQEKIYVLQLLWQGHPGRCESLRVLWQAHWERNRAPTSDAPPAGRKIAGVCAGFAEYFDLDVTLVRLVWLLVGVMTGVGLLSYPIAWVVMPEEPLRLEAPAGHPSRLTSSAHCHPERSSFFASRRSCGVEGALLIFWNA